MIRTIRRRFTDAVLWEGEAETVKDALHAAIAAKADLSGADLSGANVPPDALVTGETWREYLAEVVPALLVAGGKSLDTFAPHFNCHSWDNCPIAYAFDTRGLDGVPILLRRRADEFIRLFDSHLIPWPLPTAEQIDAAWAVKLAEIEKARAEHAKAVQA